MAQCVLCRLVCLDSRWIIHLAYDSHICGLNSQTFVSKDSHFYNFLIRLNTPAFSAHCLLLTRADKTLQGYIFVWPCKNKVIVAFYIRHTHIPVCSTHLHTATLSWRVNVGALGNRIVVLKQLCNNFPRPVFPLLQSSWFQTEPFLLAPHSESSLRVSLQRGASVPLELPTSGGPMAGILSVDEAGPCLKRTRWVAVRKAAGNPGLVASLPREKGDRIGQNCFWVTTVGVLNEAACSLCWFSFKFMWWLLQHCSTTQLRRERKVHVYRCSESGSTAALCCQRRPV